MKPTPAPILRHDKREFDMIARLFTAMAIREYGYRPDQAKSPIPKEIVDTFAALGLEVSTDTVRKYLKIGTGLLPKGWVPK